jgi:hypothetical protein
MSLRATLSGHEVVVEGERGNLPNKMGSRYPSFTESVNTRRLLHFVRKDSEYQEIASRNLS